MSMFLDCLWIVSTFMIFAIGIYFCFKLNFIHLNFKQMFKAITTKPNHQDGISSFKTLTMALAGRIGTGSLAGIALAIYIGGPGTIFWIWITSFLCATTAFAESVLAIIYRKKDTTHVYRGGPFYYIKNGMKNDKLAIIYALIILIAYTGGFSTIQINTMSKAITSLININPIIIGIIAAILVGTTIFTGVKGIANTTSKLIPFMAFFYLIMCMFIIITNMDQIPEVFNLILNNILNFKAAGLGIFSTLLVGMQKGIFSSEVGLGTGSIAAAISDTNEPVLGGLVQTFGIHIENLVIATLTAFVIIMSNYQILNITDPNGIEITNYAFNFHIGNIGELFVTITIILFGLSTIMAGYYYSESSLKFLKETKPRDTFILKVITLILLIVGSIISSKILWLIIDILVGIIAIINIYALFSLRKIVINEYHKYKLKQ